MTTTDDSAELTEPSVSAPPRCRAPSSTSAICRIRREAQSGHAETYVVDTTRQHGMMVRRDRLYAL
jgi:hypothetical protein